MPSELYDKAYEFLMDDDFDNAIPLFIEALESGDSEAAFELGLIYKELLEEPDFNKAIYYFKAGVSLGNNECVEELFLLYIQEEIYIEAILLYVRNESLVKYRKIAKNAILKCSSGSIESLENPLFYLKEIAYAIDFNVFKIYREELEEIYKKILIYYIETQLSQVTSCENYKEFLKIPIYKGFPGIEILHLLEKNSYFINVLSPNDEQLNDFVLLISSGILIDNESIKIQEDFAMTCFASRKLNYRRIIKICNHHEILSHTVRLIFKRLYEYDAVKYFDLIINNAKEEESYSFLIEKKNEYLKDKEHKEFLRKEAERKEAEIREEERKERAALLEKERQEQIYNYQLNVRDTITPYEDECNSKIHFSTIKDKWRKILIQNVKKRNITTLVHFTDGSNLNSILKYGILSRRLLDKKGIDARTNDNLRMDNNLNAISVSITNPNLKLLNAFIKEGKIKDPVIINIDASILGDPTVRVVFSSSNAASSRAKIGPLYTDFQEMFTDISIFEQRGDMPDNMPTDIQAEILVEGEVPLKYIKGYYRYRNKYR